VAALFAIFLGGLFLIDPATSDMRVSLSLLIPLVLAVGVVGGLIGFLLYRDKGGLGKSDQIVGALARITEVEEGGRQGRARANGELWFFEAQEAFKPGDEAIVSGLEGMRIQVKRRNSV
jgi:membrane protein implicated in regulation of membrane protease activity